MCIKDSNDNSNEENNDDGDNKNNDDSDDKNSMNSDKSFLILSTEEEMNETKNIDAKPNFLMIKKQNKIANIEVSVGDRYANGILAELTKYGVNQSAVLDTVHKWKTEGNSLKEAVERGKRVTSGLTYAHRKPVLNSEYQNIIITKRQLKDNNEKNILVGKMKKFYLLLYKYR